MMPDPHKPPYRPGPEMWSLRARDRMRDEQSAIAFVPGIGFVLEFDFDDIYLELDGPAPREAA